MFQCAEDQQCRLGGELGVCEPAGYCSFPDATCPSGYRYDDLAGGGLAGTCVGDEPVDAPIEIDGAADAPPGTPDGPVPTGCLAGIAAGDAHACVRKTDGSVWCWGRNTEGQLTSDLASEQETPQALAMVTGASIVETGGRHTCVRVAGDLPRCFGSNTAGQLGNNSTASSPTPVAPVGLGAIDDIDGGGEVTCAIASADGGVYCWGRNGEGQVGDGTAAQQLTPVRTQLAAGGDLVGATDVTAGWRHACAVAGGATYCWGLNGRGQLGDGSTSNRTRAVLVMNLTGATRIEAGRDHTCAIAGGGSVWCWGMNDQSQVGDGTGDGELHLPVMVIASGAVGLDLGDNHACAVMSGGALRCWGRNAEGQIADPASGEVLAPALVPDLGAPITAAATGARFSCFVVGTTVACRGSNDSAELGVGPADPVSTPHPVPQTLAIGCP